jgi:hypothetical protein
MAHDAFWPDGAKKEPPSITCPVCERLGERATLVEVQDADHSFHVPARIGRKDRDVRAELLNALTAWTRDVLLKGPTQGGQLTSERCV